MLEQLPPRHRNIALLIVGCLVFWFFWSIRAVVNPLLLGYVFAFIAQPLLRRLKYRGLSHGLSAALVFGVAFGLTALLCGALFLQLRDLTFDIQQASLESATAIEQGPPKMEQGPAEPVLETGEALPERALDPVPTNALERGLQGLRHWVERHIGADLLPESWPTSQEALGMLRGWWLENSALKEGSTSAGISAARNAFGVLKRFLDWIFGFGTLALLVPLYTYFLMFQIDSLHAWVGRHLPKPYRAQWADVGAKIGDILSNFLRGRVVIAAIKGLVLSAALALAGVPYSFLVGLLSGAMSLMPFIGALIGYALGLAVACLEYNFLSALLLASAIFLAAELLEGYVLIPRILGKSLGLSELSVIFSITAGGSFAGLFGVIVAVPVAAATKVLFLEFVEPALRQFADEGPLPPGNTIP